MVRLLMFHTPSGDSFLYANGEENPVSSGERVKRFTKGTAQKWFEMN